IGDAIVVPPVLANQFELKIELLNLVTAISFHGFANDDPHSHIRSEAWERFKDLLNRCPHRGFSPLYQIDTFYNGLNQSDQDSLNSAVGGNLLMRNTQEALTIIENKSKVRTSRNKPQVSSTSGSSSQNDAITALTKQVEALVSSMNKPIYSIEEGCKTCGGPHSYFECQAVGGYTQDVYATTRKFNAGGNSYQPQGNSDSEASINLMPLSIYEKLGIKHLKPTRMTLELANRSVTYPTGIAEDVIVKVDKFNFLADFIIVDFEADLRVLIILGRPFVRTAKALVDLYEEKLTLRIGNEELVLSAENFSKNSLSRERRERHSVHSINTIEEISNQNKQSSGSTTSHSNISLPSYESFCFDIDHKEEKSSGSTTSQSDHSLQDYEAFCFGHQE
ncbi:reverse transcriptase domain-containing protein, partial [Tanacetum coccineum]